MSDNFLVFARKNFQIGTTGSVAISYTRVSNGAAYTPQVGDYLVVFLSATKNASGNAPLSVPTNWDISGQSPTGNNNGSVNQTGFVLTRAADGTSLDTPTITLSATNTPQWQAESFVLRGLALNNAPSSPLVANLPQVGNGSTTTGANTGQSLTTHVPDEVVISFLGLRATTTAGSLVWSGTTVDVVLTQIGSSTNNFISVAITRKATPGAIQPSATWSSGAGVVSSIITIGFQALGDRVGVGS